MMNLFTFIFLVIYYLRYFPRSVSLSSDGLCLLSLKSAINEPPEGSALSDWNENDATPCHWSGVSCVHVSGVSDPRVVAVDISGKNIRGYIPSELGNLLYLRRLNFHNSNFHGSIPDQLSKATLLHSIFLNSNNLSGSLPPSIFHLPRLQNLDLSSNSLSGSIPKDLKSCRQLQRLVLANNRFSGKVPTDVWSELDNLVELDLSANDFTGSIPEDIGELKSLSGTLNLSFNQFSGRIPRSLANLPVTVSIDFQNNNLSGEISQIGTFSNQGPTAFLNNPLLCGFPLRKPCQHSDISSSRREHGSSSRSEDSERKRGLNPGLVILISSADAAGVALIGLIIVYIYWKRKGSSCSCTGEKKFGGNGRAQICTCVCPNGFSTNESEAESEKGGRRRGGGELVAIDKGFKFELDELLRASAYILGKSGMGTVYKVVLGNGVPVAVRRLGEGGEQRYKEFAAEVQAIGRVKHPNILNLRAYYWAPDEKLLVSDFISNCNLASIPGRNGQPSSSSSSQLGWSIRLKIAKQTARGLAYLHECSPRKFVHGDIKPSNILLDNDFNPYISDFGVNNLIAITGGNNPPSSVSGAAFHHHRPIQLDRSNNYKAPEARVPGHRPTQKWDVYSYGVVLLELLTGRSPPEMYPATSASAEAPDLVRWVRKGFGEERPLSDMVDPMLLQEANVKNEVIAVFHVALACTEGDPEIRPRMKTVSEKLERIGK